MIDTKDQSNAIVYCVWYGILFVDIVDMKIKAHNALNAMFVETVDGSLWLTQHCIQSTVMCENSTLLCTKWLLAPPSLPSCGLSC